MGDMDIPWVRPPEAVALDAPSVNWMRRSDDFFGKDADWIDEGLQVFADAARRESHLGLFGRLALYWDLKRLEANGRRIERSLREHPHWAAARIERPLFILGLPRSGSTFLHRLLALDPENRVPRCWQTMHPAPRPVDFDPLADRRCRATARDLRFFEWLAPEMRSLHPIDADSPQECTEIMSLCGRSLRFDTTHRVPSYLRWLETGGYDHAYAFHKRFLQFLQAGNEDGRWVLKSPDHLFAFDALRRTYPDARFVILHRDPAQVLPSVARLTEVLRKPFARHIDPLDIGQQVAERWCEGLSRLLALERDGRLPSSRVFHLRYKDLTRDPAAAIEAIYGHCGYRLGTVAQAQMRQLISAEPRGGYGVNRYDPSRYGYDGLHDDPLIREYCEYFGLRDHEGSPRVFIRRYRETAVAPAIRISRRRR